MIKVILKLKLVAVLLVLAMSATEAKVHYDCLAPTKINVVNLSTIDSYRNWKAEQTEKNSKLDEKDESAEKTEDPQTEEDKALQAFGTYIESSSRFFANMYHLVSKPGAILYLNSNMKAGKQIVINENKTVIVQNKDKSITISNVLLGNNVIFDADVDVVIYGTGGLIIEDETVISKKIQLEILDNEVVVIGKRGIVHLKKGEDAALDYMLSRIFPEDTHDKELMLSELNLFISYLTGDPKVERLPDTIEKNIHDVLPYDEATLFKAEMEEVRNWYDANVRNLASASDEKEKRFLTDDEEDNHLYEPRNYIWQEGAVINRERQDHTAEMFFGKIEEARKIIQKKRYKKTLDVQHFRIPRWIQMQT